MIKFVFLIILESIFTPEHCGNSLDSDCDLPITDWLFWIIMQSFFLGCTSFKHLLPLPLYFPFHSFLLLTQYSDNSYIVWIVWIARSIIVIFRIRCILPTSRVTFITLEMFLHPWVIPYFKGIFGIGIFASII